MYAEIIEKLHASKEAFYLSIENKGFYEFVLFDKLVKSQLEAFRWLDKKVDMQGVVFFTGLRLYMQYVTGLQKTYNAGDRTFYDAILFII